VFTHVYNFSNQDFTDTNFVITQIATNAFGCADTLTQPIIIQPEPPIPNFTYADSVGCSPLSVAFYNRSTYGREYLWDFGDKGISAERDPVHVFTKAGKYTVKLTVSGFGGVRSITKDTVIEVQQFGSALFTSSPLPGQEVIIPETRVEFRPLYPCNTCTYLWSFGDGKTSSEPYPKHLYATAGLFDVALTVTSSNGCVSIDTVKNAVLTIEKRLIIAPTAFAPSRAGSNGGYISNSSDTKVFYPFTQGMVKMKMLIFNRWGQLMYQSTDVGRGWDGYHNGAIAPADTYVYRIEASFANGESTTVVGDVTLIH
jgi:gliding motility-associated-like protein